MKTFVAFLWVNARGLQPKVASAPALSDGDPDLIDLRGWTSPEGTAVLEKQIAARHVSFLSEDVRTMDPLITYRRPPMGISLICKRFSLDANACARVQAYLGRLAHSSGRVTVKLRSYSSGNITCDRLLAVGVHDLCTATADAIGDVYRRDFCKALNNANRGELRQYLDGSHALIKFGDNRDFARACYPTIYKTRRMRLRDDNYVLLDLNHYRHWGAMRDVSRADIPFGSKKARLVWRGGSTGICDNSVPNTRMMLCAKWFTSSDSRVDVGFSSVVQLCTAAQRYMKPEMSLEALLRAKYILVVNGNDKASGLSWALATGVVPEGLGTLRSN